MLAADTTKQEAIENKIRDFLVNDLMKDTAQSVSLEDELDIDSIEQVEIRVFLEENFQVDLKTSQVPLNKIKNLIDLAIAAS